MTVVDGKTINRKLTASYLALIRRFPLRPITSEAELDRATALVNELLDRDRLDAAEDDYLDVLSDLIERYENKHHPIEDVSADEMLAFLIEQKGVTQAGAARGAGIAESTVSEVLSGKRQLTRKQIEKLASYFHVSPAVFLSQSDNGPKNRLERNRTRPGRA
jgi:HTH-type transcriptional regulator / antitoxin HigA